MRKGFVLFALLLAGCAGAEAPLLEATDDAAGKRSFPTIRTISCEGPARVNCKFINSPVKLSKKAWRFPDSPYPYHRTRNDLKFISMPHTMFSWRQRRPGRMVPPFRSSSCPPSAICAAANS